MRDLHADRARAESFGSLAEQYDRLRPTIPDALVDDLVALRPSRVLDVGCGTGKVARALTARGLSVLGIEPDERMAAVARRHGVTVEVAEFEAWDDRGRTFDLIVCADAWHWIDPERGWRRIGRVLAPGGTVVRIWNHHEVEPSLDDVYRRVAPEIEYIAPGDRVEDDPRVDHLTYRWETTYTAREYVALTGTFSAQQALEPERRAELQRALQAAIMAAGGIVTARYRTVVSRSRAMPR